MGQYYYIVNLDKRECLNPHKLGDGWKLLEFGCSQDGTMTALAILLADGNGRGGGDLHIDEQSPAAPIVGSWAGDRIVVAGDYADPGRWIDPKWDCDLQAIAEESYAEGYQQVEHVNLYAVVAKHFKDISGQVVQAMLAGDELRAEFQGADDRFGLAQVPLEATDATPLVWDESQRPRRWKLADVYSKNTYRPDTPSKPAAPNRRHTLRPDLVIVAKPEGGAQ